MPPARIEPWLRGHARSLLRCDDCRLILILAATAAGATGPSSALAKIVPIAARGDAVLFRTMWTINGTGAHVAQPVEFGWLVATSGGAWEQVLHRRLEPKDELTNPEEAAYEREFEAPFDWDWPPKSVQGLLRRYRFRRTDAVGARDGAGLITWDPKRLCQGARCWPTCRQQSLHGLKNDRGSGSPVRASFVRGGLAVFENDASYDRDSSGASFSPTRPLPGWGREGIDAGRIAGVCRLPKLDPAYVDPAGAIADEATPGTRWTKSLLGDVTLDGERDVTLFGVEGNRAVVEVVEGPVTPKSRHWTLRFAEAKDAEDGLCGPAKESELELEQPELPLAEWGCSESLDERCARALAIAARFEKAKPHDGRGLQLSGGDCDRFHLYFDGEQMTWWRR